MDSIFNRPPSISEDTLQYTVFPSPEDARSEASVAALGARIQSIVDQSLPKSFIWHRDSFELKVVPFLPHESSGPSSEKLCKLEGRMRVGDSVNDEWCVVWLWRELTNTLDIAVSIFDSDGEFLLIEAADALPAWVSPSNAENRVWLYKSHLHLIPIFYTSSANTPRVWRRLPASGDDETGQSSIDRDAEEYLGPADALRLLRDPSVDSQAPAEVEARIWARISEYPSAAQQHMHRCSAYIPLDIALALQANPSLIQRAVETFYTRDALQLRAVHTMSKFPPSTSILATVRMTRPAYAQLIGQKFHPPKVFGRWTEREGTPEWKKKNLGMKIACGFEMLYAETKTKGQTYDSAASGQSIEALRDALKRDAEYQKYIKSLQRTTYFDGEIEGSARWAILEGQAARIWVDIRRIDDASRKSFASTVNEAISQSRSAAGDQAPEPATFDLGEDDDAWMSIDSDMLDDMLASTSAPNAKVSKLAPSVPASGDVDDAATTEEAERLQHLAGKVQAFVEGEGDLEGAKFDDDLLSDEEFSDDAENDGGDNDADSSDDSADEADLEERKNQAAAKLVPPLPAGEYGVMPASFSASQSVSAPTIATETVAPLNDSSAPPRAIRKPILMRDKYDGVDSDDETDPDDDGVTPIPGDDDEDESDEDRPTVVGEIEVDMEAEEEEFLKFSRDALGITEAQWDQILSERSQRGAFIPASAESLPPPVKTTGESTKAQPKSAPNLQSSPSAPGPNPDLDSFEAVMRAMDEVLASQQRPKTQPTPTSRPQDKGKGKAKEPPMGTVPEEGDTDDLEEAMAAELKAALEGGSDSEGDEDGEGTNIDYNLIKNFLQSFKAQEGLAGPVSNLAGRLQGGSWTLPRDTS